jgi:hypothetical protein
MEFMVYDGATRNRLMISVSVAFALAALSATLVMLPHDASRPVPYVLFILPLVTIVALFAVISIPTGVRIRIEAMTGEVARLYSVFGVAVRRDRFRLSDFDRVSLHRAFRAGYQISLLGPKQDLTVFSTPDLGAARDQAQKIAAECRLNLKDQL